MYILNWQIRPHIREFNVGVRLPLLISFLLHANMEGQFYPSTEHLAHELGCTQKTIVEARKWLLERGVWVKVPYSLRTGKLLELPRRQTVYQLTGWYMPEGGTHFVPYLYLNPEAQEQMADRVRKALEISEVVGAKISLPKTLLPTPKGNSISKGNSNDLPTDEKPKRKGKANPMFDALVAAFGYNAETLTKSENNRIGKAASDLAAGGYTADDVQLIYDYCAKTAREQKWSTFTVMALPNHAGNWRRSVEAQKPKSADVPLNATAASPAQDTAYYVPEEDDHGFF